MSILEFVTQDELDNLSEDPQIAFMELVNAAQRSFSAKIEPFSSDDQNDWHRIEDIRYNFMNAVIASARRFEIEPFSSMAVPTYQKSRDGDFFQFKSDLDHYITQIIIDNSRRSRRDTVEIPDLSKQKIRTYITALRKCIEDSHMADSKRAALLKKLDAFESELEKRRLSMMDAARLTYLVLGVPGTVWASVDIVHKLTNNIMQTVAESKHTEDEKQQLPPAVPPKALVAPRPPEPARTPRPGAFDSDLDDDVPF